MASGLTPWPPDCPAIPYADCQRVVCANLRGKGWNEEASDSSVFFCATSEWSNSDPFVDVY